MHKANMQAKMAMLHKLATEMRAMMVSKSSKIPLAGEGKEEKPGDAFQQGQEPTEDATANVSIAANEVTPNATKAGALDMRKKMMSGGSMMEGKKA